MLFRSIPYKVGGNGVEVSHLQFADDTLFLGEAKEGNIVALKSILRCFELFSGLKINFRNCSLMGIGIEDAKLNEWDSDLNCEVGSIPFPYLGLSIGAIPSRGGAWKSVVEKVENRLKLWENNYLSLGKRVVLNSALASLPIYHLSFHVAPEIGRAHV